MRAKGRNQTKWQPRQSICAHSPRPGGKRRKEADGMEEEEFDWEECETEDVKVKGISSVTDEDLGYSKRLGYTMKLIGIAQKENGKIEVAVEPTLLPETHP